ncbi:tetratricopeptide repeat protein [Roseateles sp. DB2]|uniref:tetratricopeptide repeat protein n=1 Tax=Roseateles sp. DB2 TaxID=3453717 RepID=UPI003EEEC67C
MSDLQHLSQQELLGLALDAFKREDNGRALAYLKEAGAREDASSQILFMLGSEYAQIGMIPEAKAILNKAALALPALPLARFQLGLLHLSTGELDQARSVWQPLLDLSATSPASYLQCFAQGLLDVSTESWDSARAALQEGIALNTENAALNKDMQGVLDRMAAMASATTSQATMPEANTPADPAPATAELEASHLFISAYKHRGKPH